MVWFVQVWTSGKSWGRSWALAAWLQPWPWINTPRNRGRVERSESSLWVEGEDQQKTVNVRKTRGVQHHRAQGKFWRVVSYMSKRTCGASEYS